MTSTIRQEMYYERAVAPNGRSGGQWAIWEAIFSPVGEDGYAARPPDKVYPVGGREPVPVDVRRLPLRQVLVESFLRIRDVALTQKHRRDVGPPDAFAPGLGFYFR